MLKHELLHSPRMHMPKHEAAAWFEVEDAETELSLSSEQMLRHSGDCYDAETRTPTVSSQGAQFTWLKQPVNCDAETASAAM
jgi:hypothetical protein